MRGERLEERRRGLPLGSPLSPLLANLVLHELDVALCQPGRTVVRFAEDLVVCCESEAGASAAMVEARDALVLIGLRLHEEKSRVLDVRKTSLVFLGHLIRHVPSRRTAEREHPSVRTLYLSEAGLRLRARAERLVVERSGVEVLSTPVRRVRDVVVLAPVDITSAAVSTCLTNGIDISFLSSHGRWWGSLRTWQSPFAELRTPRRLPHLTPQSRCRSPS